MYFKPIFIFVAIYVLSVICLEFTQEHGRVDYFNPKYSKNVTLLTFRKDRHSPYTTSGNATNLVPFGNNVTFRMEFTSSQMNAYNFRFDFKCDDIMKLDWLATFITAHSDMNMKCPIEPGTHHFYDMALPPKNLPVQLSDADYTFYFYMFYKKTNEMIVKLSTRMKSKVKG